MIDTVSHVFGILDGSSTLSGGNLEIEIKINGKSTENELQDTFLGVDEEKKSNIQLIDDERNKRNNDY